MVKKPEKAFQRQFTWDKLSESVIGNSIGDAFVVAEDDPGFSGMDMLQEQKLFAWTASNRIRLNMYNLKGVSRADTVTPDL